MDHASPEPQPDAPRPSPLRRHAFRFGALYFALYALPFPLNAIPGLSLLAELYAQAWATVIPWVGHHVLGIGYEIAMGPSGSGDTTAEWVKAFMVLTLAATGSVAWSAVHRQRSHPTLAAWLMVWARYWLASIMLEYGFAKLFMLQFPQPDPFRLLEPIGDASPMGLLWTFMGYSPAYQAFTGGVEVLGGLLLLWRRTTTLGALVCVGAMVQVVMLNFCFDVPVKLFSSHLLLVSLVIAGLDAERLLGVLVLGRAVPARHVPPVLAGRRGRRVRLAIKSLYIAWMLVALSVGSLQAYQEYGRAAPRPPLYGMYEVTAHEVDAHDQPVLASDERTWRHVSLSTFGRLALWPVHGESIRHRVEVDVDAGTMSFMPDDPSGDPQVLRFHAIEGGPDDGALVIEGTLDGVEHRATLHRIDEQRTQLMSRGFHWINEQPLNR